MNNPKATALFTGLRKLKLEIDNTAEALPEYGVLVEHAKEWSLQLGPLITVAEEMIGGAHETDPAR